MKSPVGGKRSYDVDAGVPSQVAVFDVVFRNLGTLATWTCERLGVMTGGRILLVATFMGFAAISLWLTLTSVDN